MKRNINCVRSLQEVMLVPTQTYACKTQAYISQDGLGITAVEIGNSHSIAGIRRNAEVRMKI